MTITVEPCEGGFYLSVSDGRMRAMPAGPRLFRAEPHPKIQFAHVNKLDAESDAQKLRDYLAGLAPKKQSKKELREFSE